MFPRKSRRFLRVCSQSSSVFLSLMQTAQFLFSWESILFLPLWKGTPAAYLLRVCCTSAVSAACLLHICICLHMCSTSAVSLFCVCSASAVCLLDVLCTPSVRLLYMHCVSVTSAARPLYICGSSAVCLLHVCCVFSARMSYVCFIFAACLLCIS